MAATVPMDMEDQEYDEEEEEEDKPLALQSRSSEWNRVCPHCNRALTSRKRLQAHIFAVHNGTLPYPCKVCGTKFSSQSQATRHSRETHGGEAWGDDPFQAAHKCTHCSKTYLTLDQLQSHFKETHVQSSHHQQQLSEELSGDEAIDFDMEPEDIKPVLDPLDIV